MGFFDDLVPNLAEFFSSAPTAAPDLGQFAADSAGAAGDLASAAPDLASAASGGFGVDTLGLGGADTGAVFNPNSVGPPPVGGPAPAVLGSVAPGQGSAVVGTPFGGPDDTVPATAHESQAEPWWKGVSGGDVNRSTGSPDYLRSAGLTNPNAPSTPSNVPTWTDKFMTSVDKIPQGIADVPSKAADAFAENPVGMTAKTLALGAPLIAAGVNAANAPKAPGKYTLSPPARVAPLPGTSGTSSADIPAASPMSTTLTGQGGFKVNSGQGLAEGGRVDRHPEGSFASGGIVRGGGYPEMAHPVTARRPFVSPHPTTGNPAGLRAGGPVVAGDAQAAAIMAYLDRMDKMKAARQPQGAR